MNQLDMERARTLMEQNIDPYIDAALRAPYNVAGMKLDNLGSVYKCDRVSGESDEKYRPRLVSVMKDKLGQGD